MRTCSVARAIARRLQVMSRGPFADADASLQTIFARRAEMNATIHTAVRRFASRSRETGKGSCHSREKIRTCGEPDVVRLVKQCEHGRSGGAERAVAGDVIREGRRHDEGIAGCIGVCGRIAVGIGVAIAVPRRQLWNVYLASQAQMAPSAMAMVKRANNVAFSYRGLTSAAALSC